MAPTIFVQQHHHNGSGMRPAAAARTVSRQGSGIVHTLGDFHASLLKAGARKAGISYVQARRNYDGPSSCREAPAGDLKNRSTTAAATSGATSLSATSAAATPMRTTWVWHPPSEPPQPGDRKPQQQRQQQQQRGETEAFRVVTARDGNDEEGTLGGDAIDNNKMFAKARPASFQSSCSTQAPTERSDPSENGSKISSPLFPTTLDDPFLHHLSDMSSRFPEPPTRPPLFLIAASNTTSSSSPPPRSSLSSSSSSSSSSSLFSSSSPSRHVSISSWGKNITSSLSSAQWLLPPRWRKRLHAGGIKKRCRKSTSLWVARSKATSSMSESSLFARALSINDKASHHNHRRGREPPVATAAASASPKSSAASPVPQLVSEEPAQLAELAEGKVPQVPVRISEESEQERQEEEQKQAQQQRQHHQGENNQESPLSHGAPPSNLPTPVPPIDPAHTPPPPPPPPPPMTAPKPPRQQQLTAAPSLAVRLPPRRFGNYRFSSGSSSGSSQSTTPKESVLTAAKYMTLKNRLASSGSSIFEEDGDDSKKTTFANPYTLSPAPAAVIPARVAAAPASGPGPAAAAAAAAAAASKTGVKDPRTPLSQCSSGDWVWGGKSTDGSVGVPPRRQRDSPAPRAGGGVRMRGGVGVAALAIEINRQDVRSYGDRRRRMKDGDSGIWLPSPDIWSSARRPTPLNCELFSAW
ncbi:unnamed protein product [Pylaiella littoralis]